jgi:hypothetical protein
MELGSLESSKNIMELEGKGQGYIPKMLGPRILGTSTPHLGFTHRKAALPNHKSTMQKLS